MPNCPRCARAGRKVKRVTLESLLRPDLRAGIGKGQYYLCATPECDTVYFGLSGNRTFRRSDLTVRFGLKEAAAPRPVCYCFDHSVEEIEDEIRRTGDSTVVERIKADMKGPGCRCAYTNPLGTCCLNTVQAAVAEAFRLIGDEEQVATVGAAHHTDCGAGSVGGCYAPTVTTQIAERREPTRRAGAGFWAACGSLVAAILSSACCWLPLLLIAFGASAAGVAGFFEAYRPYFIAGAAGLLGVGFYMVYFPKQKCEPGSACAAPKRKLKIANQIMLWTATALVGAFVFFPNYVGHVFGPCAPATAAADDTHLATLEFRIEGMTCAGCANILHNSLAKLPGVRAAEIDYATKTAVVRYEPDKPVRPERVIEAVKAAGYNATRVAKTP